MTDELTHPIHGPHSIPDSSATQAQDVAFSKDKPQQFCADSPSAELIAARECVDILNRLGCYVPTPFQAEINAATAKAKSFWPAKVHAHFDAPATPAQDGATPETDSSWEAEWTIHRNEPRSSPAHGMYDKCCELERARDALRLENAELREELLEARRYTHDECALRERLQLELAALRKRIEDAQGELPPIAHIYDSEPQSFTGVVIASAYTDLHNAATALLAAKDAEIDALQHDLPLLQYSLTSEVNARINAESELAALRKRLEDAGKVECLRFDAVYKNTGDNLGEFPICIAEKYYEIGLAQTVALLAAKDARIESLEAECAGVKANGAMEVIGYLWVMPDGSRHTMWCPIGDDAFYCEPSGYKEFHILYATSASPPSNADAAGGGG